MNSSLTDTSALTLYADAISHQQNYFPQDLGKNDPVNWDLSGETQHQLPLEFEQIAVKLHQNYLYWKYLRESEHQTEATFYRYTQTGIEQAVDKVKQSGIPIEERVVLIIETKIALATLNALLIAAEDYLKAGHLQDSKETVETALSILYELIQNREKLEPSLEKAIETIQQDIVNDGDTAQYGSGLLKQIEKLQTSGLIKEAKFYVIRQQLEKLRETLLLLTQRTKNVDNAISIDAEKVDDLMSRLLVAMSEESYIETIEHDAKIDKILISPDGNYLVTVSSDNVVKLIRLKDKKTLKSINIARDIDFIAFSNDSSYLFILFFSEEKINHFWNGSRILSDSKTILYTIEVKVYQFEVYQFTTPRVVRQRTKCNLSVDLRGFWTVHSSQGNIEKCVGYLSLTKKYFVGEGRIILAKSQGYHNNYNWKNTWIHSLPVYLRIAFLPCNGTLKDVVFSSKEIFVLLRTKQEVTVIEIKTTKIIKKIQELDSIDDAIFSPDGIYVVIRIRNTIKIINIESRTKCEHTTIDLNSLSYRSNSLFFLPDTSDLVVTTELTMILINIVTGKIINKFTIDNASYNIFSSLRFKLNNHNYIIEQNNNYVYLSQVLNSKTIKIQHNNKVDYFFFSSDENYLITKAYNTIKIIDLNKLLTDIPNLLNEKQNTPTASSPQTSAIIHLDKPEAFFLYWLHTESNTHSFYEYMVQEAQKEQNGLSVKYASPILDTPLLLESLGFLLLNAEKHYQTVYPSLNNIDDAEIQEIGMQDMKQSLSAALSTLYEFISHRMELDQEDYSQAMQRFKREIEDQINHTDSLTQLYQKIQTLLQLDGIKTKSELKTLKDILEQMETIFSQLLPEEIKPQDNNQPIIPIKQNLTQSEIKDIINELTSSEMIPFISHLNEYGLLNAVIILTMINQLDSENLLEFYQTLPTNIIDSEIAIALIEKIEPQSMIELCQQFPQSVINKTVAIKAINQLRKTHYIGTISPLTDITDKNTLLKILIDAPHKTWWRS